MRLQLLTCFCALAALGLAPARGADAPNLLRNPGFEQPLAPVWEKRTPEDATRKLTRSAEAAHSGKHGVVLENLADAYTRLRQGHDRSIAVPPGTLVELSAWVRSALSAEGVVMLQLYCMDAKGGIRSQPTSGAIQAAGRWTRARVLAVVPEGTAYCMAYLQIRGGVGKVCYDDVALRVVREPRKPTPAPRVAVATDLPDDDACLKELAALLGDGLVRLTEAGAAERLRGCVGAAVLFRDGRVPQGALDAVLAFAGQGRPVFMDIRSFARWRGLEAVAAEVAQGPSLAQRMASGLRVEKASVATAGFEVGQIIPRCGADGKTLLVLPKGKPLPGVEVLAVAPGGEPGLVRAKVGEGTVVAADVLSLREPYFAHVDAYYKHLFLSNVLTSRVQFGEYYPRKLTYGEFVERMKATAAEFDAIALEDEGPACGDERLYSLNLGRKGKPLYFLYAAAHGSEWEPGYGLLTFAKRVAQGRLSDVVDLDKVRIKIMPIVNPTGYDARRRQNAHGVDLNRQGDYHWATFQGRDSNKDGTWGPGDYDWKSSAPFVEPEARAYHRIIQAEHLHCILDFHGNCHHLANRVAILPATARDDNQLRALDLQHLLNQRLRGRHLLRQAKQAACEQYLLERVRVSGATPYLMNTAARGRYGVLVELTAGYGETYGTVLQTDVTCEVCRALFAAYPPPQ